ncbi:hypothetical protein HZA86_03765 [Candidatus Uhrbacteria bacterium]|nr:hypothetical protein [Candidatus Uhrbacteria bacterium]
MNRRGWRHFGPERVIENPYYRDIRSAVREQTVRQRVAMGLLFVCVVVTVILILLFQPALQIRSVTIDGTQRSFVEPVRAAVTQTLSQKRWGIIPNSHYLFYPRTQIEQQIQSIVYAQDVRIVPQWRGKLQITITPYPITLYWQSKGNYFSVNRKGYITEQIPKIEEWGTIVEDVGREAAIGTQIIQTGQVDQILEITDGLKKAFALQPGYVFLSSTDPDVIQVKLNDVLITFDMQSNVQAQILRFKIFVDSKGVGLLKERHFVDLRFKEKIYYE